MPLIAESRLRRLSTRRLSARRGGMAPLEMVLCLPVLVFVFGILLYVGSFMIAQAEVTAEARNQAWRKRHTEARADEYDFGGAAGRVEGAAARELAFAPMFDPLPEPASRHVVMGDAWSARESATAPREAQRWRELNDHVNGELQLALARRGGSNKLGQIGQAIGNLQNLGGRLETSLTESVGDLFGNVLGGISGQIGDLESLGQQAIDAANKKQAEEKNKLSGEMQTLEQEIAQLSTEITALEMRVKEIDARLKRADNPQTKEDELTPEMRKALGDERKKIQDETLPEKREQRKRKQAEYNLKQQVLDGFPS